MTSFIDPENVTLANLAGGTAVERFNLELQKVLQNIFDPNTDPKKKRKIKMVVTLIPTVDRDYATAQIDCESSLAPLESFSMPLYLGRGADGKPIARQTHFKQSTFADLQNETPENVTKLERKAQ